MKKKILWMMLSFLLVAALVLTGCPAPEEPVVEEPVVEEPVVPVVEEPVEPVIPVEPVEPIPGVPQRGGTLTFLDWYRTGPAGFDPQFSPSAWVTSEYIAPYTEHLMAGDLEKYGPRGTNEFAFQIIQYMPPAYIKGQLAESWEWDYGQLRLTLTMRQGIMWAPNPNIGLEAREFTAYDAATSLSRMLTTPGMAAYYAPVDSITATDRYTLVVEFNKWSTKWQSYVGWGYISDIMAPEQIASDNPADWRNASGTGPFIITDYVEGSVAIYERNPNYWDMATIDGVVYDDIPFIDELVFPVITDESTRMAALRTGDIDMHFPTSMVFEENLSQIAPELVKSKYLSGFDGSLWLQCAEGGLMANRDIRRALMLAIDKQAMCKSLFVEGVVEANPHSLGLPWYTPLEERPAETRLLFDYNPELARQMLVEAEFPFDYVVEVVLGGYPHWDRDAASMIAAYWGDIGVETEMIVLDFAGWSAAHAAGDYKDAVIVTGYTNDPTGVLSTYADATHARNTFKDDYANEMFRAIQLEMDSVELTRLLKELAIYVQNEAVFIPFGNWYSINYWWPWVKNFYGEVDLGYSDYGGFLSRLWIDQDLKADMGY